MTQKRVSSIVFGLIIVVSAMIFGYLFGANDRVTEVHMTELAEKSVEEAVQSVEAEEQEVDNGEQTHLVDLNSADEALLETLPGIGPKLAERIIDYRNTMGKFHSKEEIMNVSGIGEKKYAQIEEMITVGGLQ